MRQHAIALFGTTVMGLCAATWGTKASAQEQSYYFTRSPAAPSNAFELQLSTGYTQGFGDIVPNGTITDVAGAGIGFTASVGYRINPIASVELEGQYQAFNAENSSSTQGLDGNLGFTLHAAPESRGDPWLRLATGWRGVWQNNPSGSPGIAASNNSTNLFHGWDIINARIGYDIRASNDVAWAPVVGANLQTFFWQNATALSTAQWGTFIYAGIQGRFDAAASSSSSVALAGPLH